MIQLLEQLKKSIEDFNIGDLANRLDTSNATTSLPLESPSTPTMPPLLPSSLKSSPSIDFFMLYLNSNNPSVMSGGGANLDKEWYYNIVSSACSHTSECDDGSGTNETTTIADSSSLKPKQCALMLANLDLANIMSILSGKRFRLCVLRECILLGAHRTQIDILKLPAVLKQAATSGTNLSLLNDFMHPIWLASSQCLFNLLKELAAKLPEPPQIQFNFNLAEYETKSKTI